MVNRKAYGPQTNQDGYLSWGVKNDVKFSLSHILLYLALAKDERTSLKKNIIPMTLPPFDKLKTLLV